MSRDVEDWVSALRQDTPSQPAWLEAHRDAALARFREGGFPTRREEAWKTTNPERIAELALTFVGTRYVPGTLEAEGPERLVINFRELDCVTFVENVLAIGPQTDFWENTGGTLTIDLTLATDQPVDWLVSLLTEFGEEPLWVVPVGAIESPIRFSLPVPGFPNIGTVGVLSALLTVDSVTCADFDFVDTGGAGPSSKWLRERALSSFRKRH